MKVHVTVDTGADSATYNGVTLHKISAPIFRVNCNGVKPHEISVPISSATCNGLKHYQIAVPKSSVLDWLV